MGAVTAVFCSRCKGAIETPQSNGTSYCPCGKTFMERSRNGLTWGGPGSQQVREEDPHEEART